VIWTEVHKPVRGTNHLDVTSDWLNNQWTEAQWAQNWCC